MSALIGWVAFVSGPALAFDPAPINSDAPVQFVPAMELSQSYDDNIDQSPSGDEQSSHVRRVSPDFTLRAEQGANRYQFSYRPRFNFFSHEPDDNRLDHRVNARGRWEFDARNRFGLSANASRTRAALNDTNRNAGEDEGDISERLSVDATYNFGAQDARGALEVRGGQSWNRYANNLGIDGSNKQSKEYDSQRLGGTFSFQVAPKTRALLETNYEGFDYLWAPSTLDSHNFSTRIGLTWDATAKTSGSARVGHLEKTFDDPNKDDERITDWQAQLSWNPVEHSGFKLQAQNSLEEGSESAVAEVTEEAIEQIRWSINWEHAWDDRWHSTLGYSILERDYRASVGSNVGRMDETVIASFKLDYEMQRWLKFGLEIQAKDKESTLGPTSSYEQNIYSFTLNISL